MGPAPAAHRGVAVTHGRKPGGLSFRAPPPPPRVDPGDVILGAAVVLALSFLAIFGATHLVAEVLW